MDLLENRWYNLNMTNTTFTKNLLPGQIIIDDEGNTYKVEKIATDDFHTYTITVTDKLSAYGKAEDITSNYLTKWKVR